jgi:CTP:molybdopterin cytidylyltransferase MocA
MRDARRGWLASEAWTLSVDAQAPAPRLAAVVLAAGAGRRFGGPKQLARTSGEALVARAVRQALACGPALVVVVTGAYRDAVEAVLQGCPVRLCHNENWRAGLAGSLIRGLEAAEGAADAALVLLCDQIGVTDADLRRLIRAWQCRPDRIAAARYSGNCAVPAIFPGRYWAELRALTGDRGARQVIAERSDITAVDMPAAALDVDFPDDLLLFERR